MQCRHRPPVAKPGALMPESERIFRDISELDRAMGEVCLRKIAAPRLVPAALFLERFMKQRRRDRAVIRLLIGMLVGQWLGSLFAEPIVRWIFGDALSAPAEPSSCRKPSQRDANAHTLGSPAAPRASEEGRQHG